jgi:iron complex transport system substrate-binding protein
MFPIHPAAALRCPTLILRVATILMLVAPVFSPAAVRAGEPASRVIAAGGVVTEIAYALGRQDLLVGVDTTSQFPAEALKAKPDIGYVRALSAEGILSLKPDLVLAIEGAGPPDALKLVSEAKVRIVTLPEDLTETGVVRRIRLAGAALGAEQAAGLLAAGVEAGFTALARQRETIVHRKRVLFVLSLQNGRALVGGRNTSAAAMIALAGGTNAAEAVVGFKPLSDEGLIAAAPDLIVMMQRAEHAASADEVFALPAFQAVPAAKTRALVAMDGLFLLGFGPRTPEAAQKLMRAIYPEQG